MVLPQFAGAAEALQRLAEQPGASGLLPAERTEAELATHAHGRRDRCAPRHKRVFDSLHIVI